MREYCEILFRAKSNQAWYHGYVYQDFESPTRNKWRLNTLDGYTMMINPNTICQYTGLTDMYNKKIFEGDIIKNEYENYIAVIKCLNNLNEMVAEVINGGIYSLSDLQSNKIEVIGNIFDDKEMI